jgi:glycosyltransferase involved in cell wall biosynthesis
MPTVSIIVPAYNARKGIAKCLDALLRQTGLEQPPEIIVVDDGSTDETPEIVGRYPGVRLIRQKNAGAGPARNTGIQASSGDFLLFTASDCEPDPTWAAEILKGFASDDIAMVMGSTRTDLGENNIYARTFQGRDYIAVRPGRPTVSIPTTWRCAAGPRGPFCSTRPCPSTARTTTRGGACATPDT